MTSASASDQVPAVPPCRRRRRGRVLVHGVSVDGWSCDAERGAVVFDAHAAPPAGSEVRVEYLLLECDG